MKTSLLAAILFPVLFIIIDHISSIKDFLRSKNLILNMEYMKPNINGIPDYEIPDPFMVDRIDKCFEGTDDGIHQFHQE